MNAIATWGASYRLAAALFVVFWTVLCWPWLSGALTIPFDAKAHFQAQIQFLAQALHSGQSPFWTHNVFGGSPQVADPQSLIFSPAILLALLSPSPSFRMVDAYVLAHLLAGGLALLMFFRDRGWHPAGGLLAALVFAFGASAAWRVQHIGQIASLAFFAIAFWLTARMLQRNSLLSGGLAGLAAGLMVLEPDQVALLGAYVLVGLVVAHWLSGGWSAVRLSLPPIAAAGIAGLSTIALPLLWTWLFAEATTRPAIDLAEAGRGSLHPASLLTAVIADLFGARDPKVEFWGPYSHAWNAQDLFLSQNMGQVYLGALPVLLLVVPGLTRGWLGERAVLPFSLLFLGMVLFALGRYTPAFALFYDYLPGVKAFRRPADATFLIGALGAVLAGYVLHRLLTQEARAFSRGEWLVAGGFGAALALAAALAWRQGHVREALWPLAATVGWFGVGLALLAWLARRRGAAASLGALVLVAGVVAADLRINNGANESTALAPEIYDVLRPETQNETVRTLKRLTAQPAGSPRRDRVELLGMGFEWPNVGLVHGFDHTLGYNPLRLADFSEAVGTGDSIGEVKERKFTPLFPSYRCRLADLLGLRYIASPVPIEQVDYRLHSGDLRLVARTREGFVYENPAALPRAMFVGGWQLADFDGMKAGGRWPEADAQQVVLLDAEPPLATPQGPTAGGGTVRLTRYDNTEVEIEVTSAGGGFVVLNDIWHPWWRARLDGVETEILKANVLFRAVQVPAGAHKVRFSFTPLEGALAEVRERILPAPEEEPMPAPGIERPPVDRPAAPPMLAGPPDRLRESLRLGPAAPIESRSQLSASRSY